MILAATLLWAVEVIIVKRLVVGISARTLAAARMALGTVVLLGWLAVSGRLGDLASLTGDQWSWALLTGLLLCAYVATWYAALEHAQAVDVTAVLVFGAVVTAVVSRRGRHRRLARRLVLITVGAVLAAVAALRTTSRGAPAT